MAENLPHPIFSLFFEACLVGRIKKASQKSPVWLAGKCKRHFPGAFVWSAIQNVFFDTRPGGGPAKRHF
jgi:hypothetical protein